jgi:hypothetical protein
MARAVGLMRYRCHWNLVPVFGRHFQRLARHGWPPNTWQDSLPLSSEVPRHAWLFLEGAFVNAIRRRPLFPAIGWR